MDLSIIIVNFNTKKLTLECLKSILSSDVKVRYEIVVVDNASGDESVEAFEKYKSAKRLGAKLRIIENEVNLGFSKANNIGIKSAHGRYVLLLNSDTKVKKDSIYNLYKFASGKSFAGVVGARLLNPDRSIQSSVFRLPTIYRAVMHYWFGKKILDKYAPKGDDPVEVESVVGAAFLLTPRAIGEVGFLDERYFMYFEDLDYCRKVRRMGLKVYYVPSSQIIHYHGASGGKMDFLVKSSKTYHGLTGYYIINLVIKISRLWKK
ncbi:MAG TPA: glycosyltransferase family 2 protein [Patescibacteria group bacterium]